MFARTCITIFFLFFSLLILISSRFTPYICPKVYEKGIPFSVFGSPLFPVAHYDDYYDTVEEPPWVNDIADVQKIIREGLLVPNRKNCLIENSPMCEYLLHEVSREVLNYFESLGYPYKDQLERRAKIEYWGKENIENYKNRNMVKIRRTLTVLCLHWCHFLLQMPEKERPMMSELCPNPCASHKLCLGAGEVQGTCKLSGEGFFDFQYQCDCKDGYVWAPSVMACLPANPCDRRDKPACYPQGTMMCSYDPDINKVSCLCNSKFMGENCSIPANACEGLIRNPLLPNGGQQAMGNRACNINNDGNHCEPALDPVMGPVYSCICSPGRWAPDTSLGYDNCLKKVTKCDQIICIKGKCVDSIDGKEAACVCDEGYDSPMCATWTGVWSSWGPWGRCMPACGPERWAVRTRNCLIEEIFGPDVEAEHSDCVGSSLDFTACDPHECATEEGVLLAQFFGIREHALQSVLLIAALSAVLLALIWKLVVRFRLAHRIRQKFEKPPNRTSQKSL